jgi:hypothetical protein
VFDGRYEGELLAVMPIDDRATAAILLVAVRYGRVPIDTIVARIDAEIEREPSPAAWLIDASLAQSENGVRDVLSGHAADHPILSDEMACLDILAAMRDRHGVAYHAVARLVLDLWSGARMPADLHALASDVYEDAFCAHDHDGIPQPELAAKAASAFLSAACGRTEWSPTIASVVAAGWV